MIKLYAPKIKLANYTIFIKIASKQLLNKYPTKEHKFFFLSW
jgi:hypothetical protein